MTEGELDVAKKAVENFRRALKELNAKLAEHRKQITAAGVAAARRDDTLSRSDRRFLTLLCHLLRGGFRWKLTIRFNNLRLPMT